MQPQFTRVEEPTSLCNHSYGPRVPDRTMVANLTTVLLVGFGTDGLRREEAMKTADRENPNRWAKVSGNRTHGAAGQNRSCSFISAVKQENSSRGDVFSLDFSFYRTFLSDFVSNLAQIEFACAQNLALNS